MDCLEQCLETIPKRDKEMITLYYQGEANTKISNRKKLAQESGISLNALRLRAMRIKRKLEDCVNECLRRLQRNMK